MATKQENQALETSAEVSPLLVNKELTSQGILTSHFSARFLKELKFIGYKKSSLLRLEKCGQYTGRTIYFHCKNDGLTFQIKEKHKCNSRVCPVCSKRIRFKRFRQLIELLKTYSTNSRNSLSLKFLTIAYKSYSSQREGQQHLISSIKRFLRLKYSDSKWVKDVIKGLIYVIETTKDKNDLWHVHAHIIYYGGKLDNKIRGLCKTCGNSALKKEKVGSRYYCSNRYCHSYDVILKHKDSRLVRLLKLAGDAKEVHSHITPLKSVAGLSNYILKCLNHHSKTVIDNGFPSWSVQDQASYTKDIYGSRLISRMGCFYRLKFAKFPVLCPFCKEKLSIYYDDTAMYNLDIIDCEHNIIGL